MTQLLAVMGRDVSRSLSPKIHRAAATALGFDIAYIPISASTEQLFRAQVAALRTLGALGANVTIPYKHIAFDLCDELTTSAREIGAVNTLIFRDGKVAGDNTDGPGLVRILQSRPRQQLRVVRILGAGGAARAAAWAAREVGAGRVEVAARRKEQAESFASFGTIPVSLTDGTPPTLVISSLPGDQQLAVEAAHNYIPRQESVTPWVLDLAYAGMRGSLFLEACRSVGLSGEAGLRLLAEQGALSLSAWIDSPVEPIRAAMASTLVLPELI